MLVPLWPLLVAAGIWAQHRAETDGYGSRTLAADPGTRSDRHIDWFQMATSTSFAAPHQLVAHGRSPGR